MPKGTDDKDVELVNRLALDATPLVDAFSQPFLNAHVPVIYFLPDVNGALGDHGIHDGDPMKVLSGVSDSGGMDGAGT